MRELPKEQEQWLNSDSSKGSTLLRPHGELAAPTGSSAVLGCDHEPNTTCEHCGLLVDAYGNTEDEQINCSFPDCGCDGARLCMAKNGASHDAQKYNVEGMYDRKDPKARSAKIGLISICIYRDAKQPNHSL